MRNLNIIRGVAQTMQVTLLSFSAETDPDFGPLADLCHEIVTVPEPARAMATRIGQLVSSPLPDMAHRLASLSFDLTLDQLLADNDFDIVQIEGIELARAIDIVRDVSPRSKIVFDNHNAETALQRNAMQTDLRNPRRWVAAAYSAVQVRRLARFERWAIERSDAAVAVSHEDVTILRTVAPNVTVTAIPNCIDTTQCAAYDGPSQAFDVMFMGKMDYRPNIDAVLWFVDDIWPRILMQRPASTLAIVGQKPHARLDRVRDVNGVTVTGWVESVQPYLAGCKVLVMPLRVGSGTRLKLIQALSAGKPVVTTRLGVAGYPVQDEREVLFGDSSAEFATAVLRVLKDDALAEALGENGMAFAQQYDWRSVIPEFVAIYERILAA